MALESTGNKDANIFASKIADKWICTNYLAFKEHGIMYEKFHGKTTGSMGRSIGEYVMQEGFV
ncbi:trehalase-like [Acyrthosiphon pisum]|uniref:Trehalase n=1 Tax=Acyrthosiphon pisum TaxID=7029 RepID=A0A8R2JMV2_ACYPI|nr:trehalase-like [Acyrthosiphon pisum]